MAEGLPGGAATKAQRCNRCVCTHGTVGRAFVIVGPLVIALGVVAHYAIRTQMPKLIENYAVVDSTRDSAFKDWSTNSFKGGPARFYSYTFQNLQNPEAFVIGEAPVFEERGPYTFRQTYSRVNVSFEQDGELVTFQEKFRNVYDAGSSAGKADDVITLVNPAWISVVSKYRSETETAKGSGLVICSRLWDNFYKTMLPASAYDLLTQSLVQARDGVGLAYSLAKYPQDAFFALWGGNCVEFGGEPHCGMTDMQILLDVGLVKNKAERNYVLASELLIMPGLPSEPIALDKVKRIWDAEDTYSILNMKEYNATLVSSGTFLGPFTWIKAGTDEASCRLLMEHFGLSKFQVQAIAKGLKTAKESDELFQELMTRYLRTLSPDDQVEASKITDRESLLWRQVYAADVIPNTRNNATLSLKHNARFEFGWYAKSVNKTIKELGVSQKSLYCLFDLAKHNSSLFHQTFTKVDRYWVEGKAATFQQEAKDYAPTKYPFEECFPDQLTIETLSDYVTYLVNIFFIGSYQEYTKTDGIAASKPAATWVVGDGQPLKIVREALLDLKDPRINFALLGSDDSLGGEAECHQASDLMNMYSSCVKQENGDGSHKFVRRNITLYTGKGDIKKLGQIKRLGGLEVLRGMWTGDLQIDNGARQLAGLSGAEGGPLVTGHMDGLAVPPGLLNSVNLQGTYLSFYMTSSDVALPLVYAGETERKGIKLKRFVLHPDALSAHRPDAMIYGMGRESSPAGMANVFNLTDIREAYIFVGPWVDNKQASAPMTSLRQREKSGPLPDTQSFIEVEPITGRTMVVNMHLQTYTSTLPEYLKFDIFFPKVHQAALLPMFKLQISQQLSDQQATQFKTLVYGLPKAGQGLFIGGIVVGGSMFLIGLFQLFGLERLRAYAKGKP